MIVGRYYICLKRHMDEMRGKGMSIPLRWLERSVSPYNAMHQMRMYAEYFQHVCVWDVEKQKIIAKVSQAYPLERRTIVDHFEEYQRYEFERPEGRVKSIRRIKIYADVDYRRDARSVRKPSPKGTVHIGTDEG